MAEKFMVCPPASDGVQYSVLPAPQHGSPVADATSQGHALPFRPEDSQVGNLKAEQQTLRMLAFQQMLSAWHLLALDQCLLGCTTPDGGLLLAGVINRVSIPFIQL